MKNLELRLPTWAGWGMVTMACYNFVILGSPTTFLLALITPWVFCWFDKEK